MFPAFGSLITVPCVALLYSNKSIRRRKKLNGITERTPFASLWVNCDAIADSEQKPERSVARDGEGCNAAKYIKILTGRKFTVFHVDHETIYSLGSESISKLFTHT